MQKYQMLSDGTSADAASGKGFDGCKPDRGEPWRRISRGGAEDAERAVRGYQQVKSAWINTFVLR
jgi:hypothetical protein